MKFFYQLLLVWLLLSKFITDTYAEIIVSQNGTAAHELVSGWLLADDFTKIKAGSIKISSTNIENTTIQWIEIWITWNGNPNNAFVSLSKNNNPISDYYKFSNWKTKICFSNPLVIWPWSNIDLEIIASFWWWNGWEYMFSIWSIDAYDVSNTFTFGKPLSLIDLWSNRTINTKFQDSWVIIKDSCNVEFKSWKNPTILSQDIKATTTENSSSVNTGTIVMQEIRTPVIEAKKEYSIDVSIKNFRKSKILSIQTDFETGTQVTIYKIVKTGIGGTRDVAITKVKVWKNGKVTYRLSTHGKYKIVQ